VAATRQRALRFMAAAAAYAISRMQAKRISGRRHERKIRSATRAPAFVAGSRRAVRLRALFTAHNVVRDTGGDQRIGPVRRAKMQCRPTVSGEPVDCFQIKRHQLFDHRLAALLRCIAIGNAAEQIMLGAAKTDVRRRAARLDWTLSVLFDAMAR